MSDAAARDAALDPTQSFIVQAPAGSGKTELLIQRYLALLATVQQPEQVVAITFTRKAAAEMRRRVQRALRAAADATPSEQAHERTTPTSLRAPSSRATAHSTGRCSLSRSACASTRSTRSMPGSRGSCPCSPTASQLPTSSTRPTICYREAARRTRRGDRRRRWTRCGSSLRTLLRDVGNDCEQLERLLAALLPRRDQWLGLLAVAAADELRAVLEGALQRLVDDELAAVATRCASERVARARSRRCCGTPPARPSEGLRATSGAVARARAPAGRGASRARGVARRRRAVADEAGRMAQTRRQARGLRPRARRRCAIACARCSTSCRIDEPLRAALADRRARCPNARYTDAQWRSLAALRVVLVRLAAELKVAFAERRAVDFVELALAAQRALGQVDAPSELLLALDRRIQHLLVDEFQDTSQSQRRLLELLTAGWQPDDGRTLFLVGDPMQSIYRFRDADMSLFLLAKQRGIGPVRLTSLTLQRNFRSAPAIVDWVNAAFAQVFPGATTTSRRGRAAFRAERRHARCRGRRSSFALTRWATATGAEAARVVEILGEERARARSNRSRCSCRAGRTSRGYASACASAGSPCTPSRSTASASNRSRRTSPGSRARCCISTTASRGSRCCARHGAAFRGQTSTRSATTTPEPRSGTYCTIPTRLARLTADGRARAGGIVATLANAFDARERHYAEPLGGAHLARPRRTGVLGRRRGASVGGAVLRVA